MKSFLQQNKARDQQLVLDVLQHYPSTTEQLIEELQIARKALLDATHSLEQEKRIWKKGKYWHLKENQPGTDEQTYENQNPSKHPIVAAQSVVSSRNTRQERAARW